MDVSRYTLTVLKYCLVYILNGSPTTICSSSHYELTLDPEESSGTNVRGKRQDAVICNFGTEPNLDRCNWSNRNGSTLSWELGAGVYSNWLGGPRTDAGTNTDSVQGGYIFFETSLISYPPRLDDLIGVRNGQGAFFESPITSTTRAEGRCITFSYQIDGLSSAGLRAMLQPVNSEGRPDGFPRVLWATKDRTGRRWRKAKALYTYNKDHQIIFEGIAKDFSDPFRKFRGYVAIDDVAFSNGVECRGHCTFEGGFCDWINEDNDDFNWSLGRGSRNPSTGPATDRSSFMYGGMEGGYAYIDTAYPRRPGDVATLSSAEFEATVPDSQMCMRFWHHMYGNGVGSLSVSISDATENVERDIWYLSGESGNAWNQAEVPISSSNPFKIIMTGRVGKNNLGDIAVDDISLTLGSCPTAPQTAAAIPGDCTFEVDECGWSNVGSRERLDDIDWERTSGLALRNTADHTYGTEKGYLMSLARTLVQKPGSRAWFTSRDLRVASEAQPGNRPKCVSFWFILSEPPFIESIGPSLGALTVYIKSNDRDAGGNFILKPVWRLYNHQGPDWQYAQALIPDASSTIVVEGIWGSGRTLGIIAIDDVTIFGSPCTTFPKEAQVHQGECRFERDMCGWTNMTDKSLSAWRAATVTRRPANLVDKTFGAPDGYIYYDVFDQNLGTKTLKLYSPRMSAVENQQLCFSFWYAAFGAGEIALLKVIKLGGNESEENSETLWSLEARKTDTTRPQWLPAQVSVDSSKDFQIVLEGQSVNGGFAVDDIMFTAGGCPTRPERAAIGTAATLRKSRK